MTNVLYQYSTVTVSKTVTGYLVNMTRGRTPGDHSGEEHLPEEDSPAGKVREARECGKDKQPNNEVR